MSLYKDTFPLSINGWFTFVHGLYIVLWEEKLTWNPTCTLASIRNDQNDDVMTLLTFFKQMETLTSFSSYFQGFPNKEKQT